MRSVFSLRSTSARVVIISQTYRPAPNSRHSVRNAGLVMPAIGARTTAGSTASAPSFNGGRAAVVGSSVLVTTPRVGGDPRHPARSGAMSPGPEILRSRMPGRGTTLRTVFRARFDGRILRPQGRHPDGVTARPLRRRRVSGMNQGEGRAVNGARVAVALGGGGARGYAQIGILEVLRERGYDVVTIAGSSMGAVIGGLFAAGGLDAYADWVRGLTHRDVLRLYDPSPRAPGAIRAEKIFARVADILGDARIEDLPIPFTAVATDLETGEERWFQDGPVNTAIRASAALPGFMTPVVLDGRLLADGGLTNPLPIAPTVAARADLTVAVAVSGRHRSVVPTPRRGESEHRNVLRFIGPRLAALRGAAQSPEPTAVASDSLPPGLGL